MKENLRDIISRIVKLMAETKTRYAVLGGVAVSLYGMPRLTLDVDISIILEKDRVEEFLKKAHKLGFKPLVSNERKFVGYTGVIPMKFVKGGPLSRCDFIVAQNMLEYLAIKRARTVTLGSSKVKVITPEDLVLQKLSSDRPRDIEDARGVILRQEKLDTGYIHMWLKKISKMTKRTDSIRIFDSFLCLSRLK